MTSKSVLPEGKPLAATLVLLLTLGACGNYSNEDLEFLNAVPAAQDLSAEIPRKPLLTEEAELAALTHDTVAVFNGALEFLKTADVIRTYPATSRIPNGRIWGPVPMVENPGWQWRFTVTRLMEMPERFDYAFQVQRIGSDPDDWIDFISGWFRAVNGVRKGTGHFEMKTDDLRVAGFPIRPNLKGETLKELIVDYSTESFPTNVSMTVTMYKDLTFMTWFTIDITYEAQANGQGAIEFLGTDSAGNSIGVVSRWLATGRGRADATVTVGPVTGQKRTQCWNDSFVETYDHTEWDPLNMELNGGDPSLCPEITTL